MAEIVQHQGEEGVPNIAHKHLIEGNQGWALCIEVLDKYVYVGTDERKIRVYLLSNWTLIEEFLGHEDGITAIAFADNMLYSGAYDHSIRSWDLKELYSRIRERAIMYREDINVLNFLKNLSLVAMKST
jgi:F-box and WD-40 domain protein 1/11/F-box/WD-40 domain protein 7